MEPEQLPSEEYTHPVAYDVEGRPLYAHPAVAPTPAPISPMPNAQPQVVHMARPIEPVKQEVSLDTKLKHDKSRRLYPTLNLSEGEYIISAVRRHPIGLFIPLAIGLLLVSMALSLLFNYDIVIQLFSLTGTSANPFVAAVPVLLFTVLVSLGVYVAYYVYNNNRFFLTNESVIQEIQVSLFAHHEQTVSLANIEDASYTQQGIIEQFFNYGSIRLSTEGDETTYRFTYVANPKQHIATLNNAVEAFKNGRPVSDSDN
ncbi:PH domain-containing protein [Candidatus Saccharibacteria bacterium]|nr:PH domain-containing protein [Candidatus Saccharibacteria bacterium]